MERHCEALNCLGLDIISCLPTWFAERFAKKRLTTFGMSFNMPLFPANTKVLNSFKSFVHNQSFPELPARANSLMWGWKESFKAAVQKYMKHEAHYISSHRLRARCSVGVKQQSLSVTFLGGPQWFISAKNLALSVSAKRLLLTSAAEGPSFVISGLTSIPHWQPPWGVKGWEVLRITGSRCWKEESLRRFLTLLLQASLPKSSQVFSCVAFTYFPAHVSAASNVRRFFICVSSQSKFTFALS